MICRFSSEATRRELTPVDNLFLTEFMPDADGTAVKVYLYGLMQCYHDAFREQDVATALRLTPSAVQCAFVYWQSRGLVRIVCDEPLTVEYLLTEQPAVTTETPVKYRGFSESANALFAPRSLKPRELKLLYDCIELYGIDEAALLELLSHCISQKGKRVSLNYVESVAQSWSLDGIKTAQAAQNYLDAYRVRRHGAAEVLRRWNRRREPTEDEMQLYERWSGEWGFDQEAILSVCTQLTAVGSPTFDILNDRLRALFEQHRVSSEQVADALQAGESDREFARLVFARMGKIEPPTPTNIAQIGLFLHEKALPRELILFAADNCLGADRPFGKLKAILSDWSERGVDSMEKAKAALLPTALTTQKRRKSSSVAHNYAEHPVNEDELKNILVDLNEDIL